MVSNREISSVHLEGELWTARSWVGNRSAENVFLLEVEEVLLAHDEIVGVMVFGVADDEFGQRLAVQVVRRPGGSIDDDEIRSLVGTRLARCTVPRDVTFVGGLPRNATGKLLRRPSR